MALVVLLRGVNVGGHRTFRPSVLAKELAHLDAVSIGAAGTFVIRKPVAQAKVRAELAQRLPFATDIAICRDRDIVGLLARDDFAEHPERPDIVRFVSVMSARPRATPEIPLRLPEQGRWLLQILATDGRFVLGLHRREMPALRYLAMLDRLFGVPLTTRNWKTMTAIGKALERPTRPVRG